VLRLRLISIAVVICAFCFFITPTYADNKSPAFDKEIKKLSKISNKLESIDNKLEKIIDNWQLDGRGENAVAGKLGSVTNRLDALTTELERVLSKLPENPVLMSRELRLAMLDVGNQAESIMENVTAASRILSEDDFEIHQSLYDVKIAAKLLNGHLFYYLPIILGVDKVIPVRFVQIHSCFLDDPTCVPHMDRNAIQHTIDGLNEVYRSCGIAFWAKSVERYRAPVFGNTNPALFDEDWICPWGLARDELGQVFDIPPVPSPGLTPPRKPLGWVRYMSTRFSDTSEILVWLFERESLVSRQQDHHSSSTFPSSGRAVILNANNLNDLIRVRTNPSHLVHELGHFFGLPHSWEVPAGYNPQTGEPLQWADYWDLVYCESSQIFFPNRAVAEATNCDFRPIEHNLDYDPCNGNCVGCAASNCVVMNDLNYPCFPTDPRYDGDSDMDCTIGNSIFPSGDSWIRGLTFPLGQPESPPNSYAFGVNAMGYLSRGKTDWRTPYRFSESQIEIMKLHLTYNMPYRGDTYPDGLHSARADLGEFIDDYIWWSNGDFTFSREQKPIMIQNYVPISGDFDANGYDDIFWYQPGPGFDTVWWSNGNRTWTDGPPLPVNNVYTPVAGDFDGNGTTDIIWYVPGPATDPVWWFNLTSRSYQPDTLDIGREYIPVVGDFDMDGDDDILWYEASTGFANVWWAQGDKTFLHDNNWWVGQGYIPVAGDFACNGRESIFWYRQGYGVDTVWWYFAEGGNVWIKQDDEHVQVNGWYRPVAGDFDGDGCTDILWDMLGTTNDLVWKGDPLVGFEQITISAYDNFTPIVGNFDNDNKSDIFWYDSH
jgi:exonuclease VII small subunit